MNDRALNWTRFESDGEVPPGRRGEAFWSPACASRLDSVEFQPGPTWHVWAEVNRVRFELPDGKFPGAIFALPGSRIRIEYLNAGDKPATARLTLWVEPQVEKEETMGTKNNPGTYDCYAKAEPDEPMFILLGRDIDAPRLVEEWANQAERSKKDPTKIAEARKCAEDMRTWRREHRK